MHKKQILIIAICLCVVWGGIATYRTMFPPKADFLLLEQGQVVGDFTFETIDGDAYALSDFNGHMVAVHFWASWCPPCIVEFPHMIEYANSHPDIRIIAVSSDRTRDAMDRFFSRLDTPLPDNLVMVHDQDNHITQTLFSVFQLPETFVLSKDGVLDNHVKGPALLWTGK